MLGNSQIAWIEIVAYSPGFFPFFLDFYFCLHFSHTSNYSSRPSSLALPMKAYLAVLITSQSSWQQGSPTHTTQMWVALYIPLFACLFCTCSNIRDPNVLSLSLLVCAETKEACRDGAWNMFWNITLNGQARTGNWETWRRWRHN